MKIVADIYSEELCVVWQPKFGNTLNFLCSYFSLINLSLPDATCPEPRKHMSESSQEYYLMSTC